MTKEKATASDEARALLTKVASKGKITNGADAYLFDMRGPALMNALLAELAQLREALVQAAIPYEALLTDAESRKWIAPEIWSAIESAVKDARALMSKLEI
jgi:hypothetical protein